MVKKMYIRCGILQNRDSSQRVSIVGKKFFCVMLVSTQSVKTESATIATGDIQNAEANVTEEKLFMEETRAMFENPFSDIELNEIFEKQKNKVVFEMKKTAKRDDGKEFVLSVEGLFVPESCFHIWSDNFIVSFDAQAKNEGHGYAHRRFDSLEGLRAEVTKAFHLREEAQIRFF